MCFPKNKHSDFDADLNSLAGHWSVGGFTLKALAGAAVRKIRICQGLKRPQGLMTRNATSGGGANATLHYVCKIAGSAKIVCIADDRRDGRDYCLNLLIIDGMQPGQRWIVHANPFTTGADRGA